MKSRAHHPLSWLARVALSRLKNRVGYLLRAPLVYRNWWAMPLAKLGVDTVLELRSGARYFVRAGTFDLAVVNECAFHDPYLASQFVTLQPDSVVIDIGANIGDFAVRAGTLCPDGRVIAVEPLTAYGRMIDTQLKLNGLRNVIWVQVALSGQDGETLGGNVGGLYASGDAGREPVQMMTLERLVSEQGLTRIDLLKLDCEGAEWDILPAADRVLPLVREIAMEFHCFHGWTPLKLAGWLEARGFEVAHTGGNTTGFLWVRRPQPRRYPPREIGAIRAF
ncbi:MAG: FkbM family methyltransferase [Acidobacteria bacterium]|nr:FkbM family methyltransferase [Acidobacteriota bacterium]